MLLRRFVGVIWCAFAFLVIDIRFDVANAQARLEAAYTATLLGIPIGDISWTIDIQQHQFSAVASGGTAGLLRLFTEGHGTSAARGTVASGQPVASPVRVLLLDPAGTTGDPRGESYVALMRRNLAALKEGLQ